MKIIRPNTRWLSGILLVLMLAVLTPKDLYHHCEHPVNKTLKGEVSLTNDVNCAVCSFQLLPYHLSLALFFDQVVEDPYIFEDSKPSYYQFSSPRLFSSRAPPSPIT